MTPRSITEGSESMPRPEFHAVRETSDASGVSSAVRKLLKSPARKTICSRPGRLVMAGGAAASQGQTRAVVAARVGEPDAARLMARVVMDCFIGPPLR